MYFFPNLKKINVILAYNFRGTHLQKFFAYFLIPNLHLKFEQLILKHSVYLYNVQQIRAKNLLTKNNEITRQEEVLSFNYLSTFRRK